MFHDIYEDVFGSAEALESYKLLQGIENFSLIAGNELLNLSRKADSEELRSLILNTPTAGFTQALESSAAGVEFLGHLRSYLGEFGTRSDGVLELADPSWSDDLTIVINNVKAYLSKGAEDPNEHWNELVAERERLVAAAREKLADYPEAVRGQFEAFMAAGQDGQRIQEDHNWWIDQKGLHQVRHVFLEFGRRLAASGATRKRDDVFFLLGTEIKDEISSKSPSDFSDVIAERKADLDRWSKVHAPERIGTDYGPPPGNPVSRALGRFFGGPPPEADPERPDVMKGIPGSPGKVTGTARVMIELSDADRFKHGEIQVTAR
jgi:pyruvate,water dikinase